MCQLGRNTTGERLKQLEQDRGVKLEGLQDNDVFIDTVLNASQIAMRHSQQEKRAALRNAVLNSALPDPPEQSLQQMFLGLVDSLTVWHLRTLKFFQSPNTWATQNGKRLSGNSIHSVLVNAFDDLRENRDFCDAIWRGLHARSLVNTDSMHTMMTADGAQAKRTTPMADSFLAFIEEPE